MCIITSRKGITVKQTVRLDLQQQNYNINSATSIFGGMAVAVLMFFFLSGLQDTDERHDDADNRDNNTYNPDKYS